MTVPDAGPLGSRWQRAWRRFEDAFDLVSPALNPLRHLGAIAAFLFCVLLASGIYLYAVIDTSVTGSWTSIDTLSREQWWLGGLLRSMHRYAADLFVLTMLAHLLREWMLGRFRGFRRMAWWTGVVLIPLAAVSAIGGFWLNWDTLGQYSAIASAEWLDELPLFGAPLTRNFLASSATSDRLFSLFVFVHIGVPLLMLFGFWFHVRRYAQAAIWPPRGLAWALFATLLVIAWLAPIMSHPPADLSRVPERLSFDWVLLGIHPLVAMTPPGWAWGAVLLVFIVLVALLWWPARALRPVAEVHPDHCSGCRRCVADCPYDAISMSVHPTRTGFSLAVVDADACAACAICVGSCPSSTPFRSMSELVTGIDMPDQPIDRLRKALRDGLAASDAAVRVAVFHCAHAAPLPQSLAAGVVALPLECAGQLPPSFIEYALRDGADGVLVSGCRESSCIYRLGQRWTELRLAGERDPKLRGSVPAARWRALWTGVGDSDILHDAIAAMRAQRAAKRTAS